MTYLECLIIHMFGIKFNYLHFLKITEKRKKNSYYILNALMPLDLRLDKHIMCIYYFYAKLNLVT